MEQRVSVITLGVADLQRSRAFYESLGWARGNTGEDIVFFQAGGLVLALWPRSNLATDVGVPNSAPGFSGVTLAQNVRSKAEVDRVMDEARAAGAKILKPAADTFWGGYSGYFADPDGHSWEIAWNPGWTLGPDGSVSLLPPS